MKITILKKNSAPIYYFFLAIIDFVSMYRAFVIDKSLSSVIIVALSLFGTIIIVYNASRMKLNDVSMILLYYTWVIIKSGTFNSMLALISVINMIAISQTVDRNKIFRKIIENVSIVAAFCVMIQQLSHFIFGIHIPFVIEGLCSNTLRNQYHDLITTGTVLGMYRPSAFFLEPAGYSCYCGIGLLSLLCEKKPDIKKALWVSLGIILTTSGMGIAFTFAFWLWRYTLGNSDVSLNKRIKSAFMIILIIAIVFLFLIQIPLFARAVGRIFGSENQLGALQGRILFWNRTFDGKTVRELLFGIGLESLPEYYMTGFMVVLWSYGIVGYVLLLLFLVNLYFGGNDFVKMVCLMYIGLMFVAQVTSLLYTTFIFGLILSQPRMKKKNYKIREVPVY